MKGISSFAFVALCFLLQASVLGRGLQEQAQGGGLTLINVSGEALHARAWLCFPSFLSSFQVRSVCVRFLSFCCFSALQYNQGLAVFHN
jgi:hypothetical protein